MAIVSVKYIVQGEATRRITYIATDSDGVEHRFGPVRTTDREYDPEVAAPLIAAKIERQLAETSVQTFIKSDAADIDTRHAAKADILIGFRDAYRAAQGIEIARLAAKLKSAYDAGMVTNAQLRATFGFDGAALTAFLSRIAQQALLFADVQALRGDR